MKKDTFYFPHDYYARNDEKILCLRAKHGAVGYGIYWIIIEMLWEQEFGTLLHKSETGIAFQNNIDITLLRSVITDCIEFDLLKSNGEKFWSETVNNRKKERDELRNKKSVAGKKGMENRWKDNTVITKNNTPITPDNKGKGKVKGNESKIKDKSKEIILPYQSENFKEIWEKWKKYKKDEHRFSFKSEVSEQESLNQLFKDAGNEEQAIEMINYSIGKGYKGIFKNNKPVSTKTNTVGYQKPSSNFD